MTRNEQLKEILREQKAAMDRQTKLNRAVMSYKEREKNKFEGVSIIDILKTPKEVRDE